MPAIECMSLGFQMLRPKGENDSFHVQGVELNSARCQWYSELTGGARCFQHASSQDCPCPGSAMARPLVMSGGTPCQPFSRAFG